MLEFVLGFGVDLQQVTLEVKTIKCHLYLRYRLKPTCETTGYKWSIVFWVC